MHVGYQFNQKQKAKNHLIENKKESRHMSLDIPDTGLWQADRYDGLTQLIGSQPTSLTNCSNAISINIPFVFLVSKVLISFGFPIAYYITLIIFYIKAVIDYIKPVTSCSKSVTYYITPLTYYIKPVIYYITPVTYYIKLVTSCNKSVTCYMKPTTSYNKSVTYCKTPVTYYIKPVTYYIKPSHTTYYLSYTTLHPSQAATNQSHTT